MLTWDSTHHMAGTLLGLGRMTIMKGYNYTNQKIRFLYHVIRWFRLLPIFFDDITAYDLFKKKNIINQNFSTAINPWWVSHLLLIKNSSIHFWGTSCLVCPTSLLTDSTLRVFFCFAPLKASQIFTELLLITAFPSQVLFSVSQLISKSAAQVWFCSMGDYSDKKM